MNKYKCIVYEDEVSFEEIKSARNRVRFGLCCICNCIRKNKKTEIFCSRTITRERFTVEKAIELSIKNCNDIVKILEWNEKNNIKLFRLTSNLFPHFTDKKTEEYNIDFARDILKKAGELANKLGHRITTHPGQYCQVGAKDKEILKSTIHDLDHHADILDTMNIDYNGIICVHGGGVYGDKELTKKRWIEQFQQLPERVKRRLAIENCEKSYSVRDCLDIAKATGIPVIFDTHHYNCYSILHPLEKQELPEDLLPEIIDSWKGRIPLFHVSDQKPNSIIGSHHDYVQYIPGYLLQIPYRFNIPLHIEIEAKAKEDAVLKLMKRYNFLF